MSYSYKQISELVGSRIKMAPIKTDELKEMGEALVSSATWFSKTRNISTPKKFVEYFDGLVPLQDRGERMALVGRLKETNEVVSMSSFQNATANFTRVEIGFTWIADKWQRTFVNTEMKQLMLQHAFDVMKTKRVEFSVHPKNVKSNAAMLRIGAQFEGILRKWRFVADGDDGDRSIYSILDDEWPVVKENLERMALKV